MVKPLRVTATVHSMFVFGKQWPYCCWAYLSADYNFALRSSQAVLKRHRGLVAGRPSTVITAVGSGGRRPLPYTTSIQTRGRGTISGHFTGFDSAAAVVCKSGVPSASVLSSCRRCETQKTEARPRIGLPTRRCCEVLMGVASSPPHHQIQEAYLESGSGVVVPHTRARAASP